MCLRVSKAGQCDPRGKLIDSTLLAYRSCAFRKLRGSVDLRSRLGDLALSEQGTCQVAP